VRLAVQQSLAQQRVGPIVIDNDRGRVLSIKQAQRVLDTLPGRLKRSAGHRAGSVHDERQIKRRPLPATSDLRRGNLQQDAKRPGFDRPVAGLMPNTN
jgi:hypothetical protein